MKRNEKKFKRQMDRRQLAALLRQVADALEGRDATDLKPLDGAFKEFSKASLKIKQKADRLAVKIKVESPALKPPAAASASPASDKAPADPFPLLRMADSAGLSKEKAKPKYKDLKKQMKSSFKHIRESLAASQVPAPEIVESFLHDSKLMIGYPGYGDEHYQAYFEACSRFSAAYVTGDLAALKEHTEVLNQIKSDCHKQYK
jgi:XXXCH domain-containing protein